VSAERRVKGVLFVDYVRMLRTHKGVVWSEHLPPEDLPFLHSRIHPVDWYPMATFERMGNQILKLVAQGDLVAVRMWGRIQVDQLRALQPSLVAAGDPVESINRFRVLRATYFDFDALDVLMLHHEEALIVVNYHMGMPAEEAASWQTLGFFERLLEVSGAASVDAKFLQKSWVGDPRTLLSLDWRMPKAS
jgi:hypothetical protein